MIRITKTCKANVGNQVVGEALIRLAEQRVGQGLAPPSGIYRVEYRRRIDWLKFPDWARPVDPQLFDGCCHEG
jgi:hypothetical protein